MMQVHEAMTTSVVTIGPAETARAAWTRMRRRGIRHLVVMEAGRVVGVLSERDLGGRLGTGLRMNRTVRDLMSPRVEAADPEMTLTDAADVMRARLIGSLPVMDDDDLVGIVTATDVFEALGREATGTLSQTEQQLLRAPASSKRLGGRPAARKRAPSAPEAPPERALAFNREKREPFAAVVPRAARREAGRTVAPQVPANIRVAGVALSDADRAYIRQRLGAKLGKFATSIERVTVRLRDVNGARGGVDKVCNIKVVLSGLPSVIFESQSASLRDAVNAALTGTERTVRRSVDRRRTNPLKAAAGTTAGRSVR
jgi:CBS domain-containing protein/ribosome-associated translation inhibitor RaiA